MSKFVSAEDVKDIVAQNQELKKYSEKLTDLNTKLQKELDDTKNKLKHLEEIAKFNSSPISVGSSEEELCKLEINRLYNAAKVAPLEFNQVKAFEIYVKSLMLIKGKTVVDDKKKDKSGQATLSNDQLLQLALQVVDDTNEQ
jgi:hypothetical protein